MAQLVVRNLDDEVKTRLQQRAAHHGQSMEEEVRDILRDALKDESPAWGLGTEIAFLFHDVGLETEIQELRGHVITPPSFE